MKNDKTTAADRRDITKNKQDLQKQMDKEIEKALEREFKKYPHIFVKGK